ncbi:MAG: L-threonylcarbamoyladenylate synthase, partial [Chlamydiales bacterium]
MRVELAQAAKYLKEGKIVGIPTETVYGLAASVFDPDAIESLYVLKERPRTNPLITQVGSIEDLRVFTENFPDGFEALANKFWPGTLTLVLPINEDSVPSPVRGGLLSAAFRIPGHPLTLALLKESGPLAVPSANKSGSPPATCVEHLESDFGKDFPVLDGGICEGGIESTILNYIG